MTAHPTVTLLAHTMLAPSAISGHMLLDMPLDDDMDDSALLGEFAGRSCYQSFSKPREATARTVDYLANIIAQKHESVLEHASATFYLQGVSRALTHELIRHRHLQYSQLSQRFVDESDADMVIPPAVALLEDEEISALFTDPATRAIADYERLAATLIDRGLPRKQAREAARALLPNATETKIVVTGNFRAWRDVCKRRCSAHADAEIRMVCIEILRQLMDLSPAFFPDVEIIDTPTGAVARWEGED